MRYRIFALIALLVLAGCDQIAERAGFPDPAQVAAEGKAIGAGCRQAGQGLEDCYRLSPAFPKAAIFAGWKEMNQYMEQNNMKSQTPEIPPMGLARMRGQTPFGLDLAHKVEKPESAPEKGATHAAKHAAKATKETKKADKASKENKKQ